MKCYNCKSEIENNRSLIGISSKLIDFAYTKKDVEYPFCGSDCVVESLMDYTLEHHDEPLIEYLHYKDGMLII